MFQTRKFLEIVFRTSAHLRSTYKFIARYLSYDSYLRFHKFFHIHCLLCLFSENIFYKRLHIVKVCLKTPYRFTYNVLFLGADITRRWLSRVIASEVSPCGRSIYTRTCPKKSVRNPGFSVL